MEKQEFIDFARENPACFMATCAGDQPHVRTLILFFADETGFYFGTLTPKEMCKQLHKNPKVELCFYNHASDLSKAKQMRVTGEVEFVDDPALKHRLHEERLVLDEIAGRNLEPDFEIVKVSAGDMHFWTMMDASHEAELEHLAF